MAKRIEQLAIGGKAQNKGGKGGYLEGGCQSCELLTQFKASKSGASAPAFQGNSPHCSALLQFFPLHPKVFY